MLLDLELVIVDIKSVITYTAHNASNAFVSNHMQKCIDIFSGTSTCHEKFYKISMNGSYRYDGMNTERYTKINIYDNDGSTTNLKLKGISKTTNHLVSSDCSKFITQSTVVKGSNTTFQMHDHIMSKVTTIKNALTGFNNMVITLSNGSCVPYINS